MQRVYPIGARADKSTKKHVTGESVASLDSEHNAPKGHSLLFCNGAENCTVIR